MTYRFMREPRWIGLTLLMILLATVCVGLGQWQMGRYEDKAAATKAREAAWNLEPVPLADIGHVDKADEWRLVTATGTYREEQVLLRGRSVDGHPALHVINLFETESGGQPTTIIVDRGWLPTDQVEGYGGSESFIPPPPAGQDTTLLLRARTPEEPYDKEPPQGYTFTLNPAQVLAAMGDPEAPGLLDGRFEAQANQLGSGERGAPLPYPRPSTSLGNHFAYAWEWRIFAVAALLIVPILARREARNNSWIIDGVDVRTLNLSDEELADLGLASAQPPPAPKRRPTDEEIEDAIIDAYDQAREISSR